MKLLIVQGSLVILVAIVAASAAIAQRPTVKVHRSAAAVVGPYSAAARGASGGQYTTQRGTTFTYGKAGVAASGPYRAGAARVGGVHVETARGRTATKTYRSGTAVGPRGSLARSSGSAAVIGPYGAAGVRRSATVIKR
jgi:hypothetical protein